MTRLLQWIHMKIWSNHIMVRKQMLFIYICIEKEFLIFVRQNIFFLRFYWQDTNTILILWIRTVITYLSQKIFLKYWLQKSFSWALYLNISWAPFIQTSVCELRQSQGTPNSSEYHSTNWFKPSCVRRLQVP